MTTLKFLPYGKQSVTKEDLAEVMKVLESDLITRGPKVEEFERAVADYCGAKHGVAFSNGTAALMAACHAADTGPYDRLITTPNTFVATVGAGVQCQSTPVFVDIDRDTGNLNLDQVQFTLERESSRGKDVIIPVHFSGISVDMKRLEKMIKKSDTIIIEDAAHAIGSRHPDGFMVGSSAYSHMTVFSFHAVKTMTTGEGGMVMTNDDELCRKLRLFRNNGIERDPMYLERKAEPWYYEVKDLTGNFNVTEMQAALGISQLKRLDRMVEKRRRLVSAYREKLREIQEIRLFSDKHDALTAFHLFVVQIDFEALKFSRTELMERLMERGIGTQLHYIPVYRHPYFQAKIGNISSYFPNMEAYYSQALSLPLFYEMEEEDVSRVVATLKEILYIHK